MSVARYYTPKVRALALSGKPLPGWLARHPRISYILAAVVSYPPWADMETIRAMRKEAQYFTMLTGEQWVLDHVIPICHPLVCGLSVPANFRIVPYRVNASKGNRWTPDQLELNIEEDLSFL